RRGRPPPLPGAPAVRGVPAPSAPPPRRPPPLLALFRNWKVSVVVPAYNEEATIGEVVADFRGSPFPDEVLVVDHNCKDRTAAVAADRGARVLKESAPGYGSALRAGLDAAAGDILVLVEADGSFKAKDLEKLLVYLPDCAMVQGTRTTRQMV